MGLQARRGGSTESYAPDFPKQLVFFGTTRIPRFGSERRVAAPRAVYMAKISSLFHFVNKKYVHKLEL
jgi:hypothetical protein